MVFRPLVRSARYLLRRRPPNIRASEFSLKPANQRNGRESRGRAPDVAPQTENASPRCSTRAVMRKPRARPSRQLGRDLPSASPTHAPWLAYARTKRSIIHTARADGIGSEFAGWGRRGWVG